MKVQRWSLRWLVGGIYFCIMVVFLGGLALYLSYTIAQNYMQTLTTTLSGQGRLGAELLAADVTKYRDAESAMETLAVNERDLKRLQDKREASTRALASLRPGHERSVLHAELTKTAEQIAAVEAKQQARLRISNLLNSINARRNILSSKDSPTNPYYRIVTLLRPNDSIIADSPAYNTENTNGMRSPEVRDALNPDLRYGVSIRYSAKFDEELLYIAVPVVPGRETAAVSSRFDDANASATATNIEPTGVAKGHKALATSIPCAVLVLAAPTTEVRQVIGQIQWIIFFAFIGGLLVLFLINAGISNFISTPLARLSDAVEHFTHEHLDRRVEPEGAYEIASLGENFNQMATQLAATIANLGAERAQAQAILASMFDGVLVTDPEGEVLLANDSLMRMFDLSASTLIGQRLSETIFREDLNDLLQMTIASRLPLLNQIAFGAAPVRYFEVHIAPVEVESHLLGAVIALYDITSQRRLEQMQRDFVANVSHELRTPVASIRAMSETLVDAGDADPAMRDEFLQTMIHESERLTSLLDDLLNLSSMESGRRLLSLQPFDLVEIIRHVARRVFVPITAKHLALRFELPETLPALVDHDAMVQILVNLLDNARKYSPEGGTITLRGEVMDERVRLHVSDTGIGIPDEEQERIFERFYRVDKARSRAAGGTGLGLSIVRHLVELHGGVISVQSTPGAGSTFTVALPAPKEEKTPGRDEAPSDTPRAPEGDTGEPPSDETTASEPSSG